MSKRCRKCGESKPLEMFSRNSQTKDGRLNTCKACQKVYDSQRPKKDNPISVMEKACGSCRETLPASAFNRNRRANDGLQTQCRGCLSARNKKQNHPIAVAEKVCTRCKQLQPADCFFPHRRNRDGLRCWCKRCLADHDAANRRAINSRQSRYERHRRRTDERFRLASLMRTRFYMALRHAGSEKRWSAAQTGMDWEGFKAHYESLFKPGQTWANTSVDHWMPLLCDEVDLSNPAHQRAICHWSNLRPMEPSANTSKGNAIEPEALANFRMLVEDFTRNG